MVVRPFQKGCFLVQIAALRIEVYSIIMDFPIDNRGGSMI